MQNAAPGGNRKTLKTKFYPKQSYLL